jgi:hypothetical protein
LHLDVDEIVPTLALELLWLGKSGVSPLVQVPETKIVFITVFAARKRIGA